MVRTRRKPLEERNSAASPIRTTEKRRRNVDAENAGPEGTPRKLRTRVTKLTKTNVAAMHPPVVPKEPSDDEVLSISDASDCTVRELRRGRKFFSVEHRDKATRLKVDAQKVPKVVTKTRGRRKKGKDEVPREVDRQRKNLSATAAPSDQEDDIYSFQPSQESEISPEDSVIQKILVKQKEKTKKRRQQKRDMKELESLVRAVEELKKPTRVDTVLSQIRGKIKAKQGFTVPLQPAEPQPGPSWQSATTSTPKAISRKSKEDLRMRVLTNSTERPPLSRAEVVMQRIRDQIKAKQASPILVEPEQMQSPDLNTSNPGSSDNSMPSIRLDTSIPARNSSIQSPWRVRNPRVRHTQYFSYSKDMLPSFSSETIVTDTKQPLEIPHVPSPGHHSPNNSDMENVAPRPGPSRIIPQTLTHRVPLQPLRPEITESPLAASTSSPRVQVLQNIPVTTGYRVVGQRLVRSKSFEEDFLGFDNSNVSDCFGFDDVPPEENTPRIEPVQPEDLREQLHQLRRLMQQKLGVGGDRDSSGNIPNLFWSPAKVQNKNLVEMFQNQPVVEETMEPTTSTATSSTTIAPEPTNVDLFDDPENLFTTQAQELRRKSYARPLRNRRKPQVDYDTEPDSEPEEDHAVRKKRKPEKSVESTEDFKKFVSEFNSMCEEVESFDVVIEKASTSEKEP